MERISTTTSLVKFWKEFQHRPAMERISTTTSLFMPWKEFQQQPAYLCQGKNFNNDQPS